MPDRRVHIETRVNEVCVVAGESIAAGQHVLSIEGVLLGAPTRHSIQIDEGRHIGPPPDAGLDGVRTRYPWRFLNHSCDPNTRLVGTAVVALRPILAGDEVTFNYNTTEYDLACPFTCGCGSPDCAGKISGFRHLSLLDRERLRPLLAPHLLRLLPESAALPTPAGEDR